ncbi:MAG TPA: TetR/AcrR family transcriptional regulator [Terriglobales bacterium]|nr:TetR/AcrR family transcriptional regulator [Terriglobales bacterium]
MATAHAKSRLGSRGKPEQTRDAILQAAIKEFAAHGIAGARTDAIARAARVNKALLYYYFKDKETLYGAALDHAFGQQAAHMLQVLGQDLPPRQKILAYVGEYFDFIAGHPMNRDLAQRELMRAGHGSGHFQRIAKRYFQPLFAGLAEVIRQGIASGEFRAVDPLQFIPSMVALVVFYFTGAPILKVAAGFDPLSPERITQRRAAVLDFVSAVLFCRNDDYAQGGGRERAQ